jgi:uroporphyrin-3 C-methyltransferase
VSDQPEDKQEKVSQEGQEAPSWNPVVEPPRPPAAPKETKPAPRRGSAAVAWLALLLVIGLCAAAAWSVREAQRREAVLESRLAVLETTESSQQEGLEEIGNRLQQRLKTGLAKSDAAAATTAATTAVAQAGQAAQLEQLEASLALQRQEITRFGATDRKDWLLAEVEYLLRLVNQRLIMAGDVVAAAALLKSADAILLELEDVSLHGVRAAVAADLAAVRAVPKVDVEGLYLRLSGLIEQVDGLAIFQLPTRDEVLVAVPAEDWQQRFQQGYEQALGKLSDYIVIRRRDVPYEALMDPQWEGLVRQNLRMLLEQAQVALLSGNQVLFRESLQRGGHWVEQFFEVDEAGSRALAQELHALTQVPIATSIPDVSASLLQLDKAMERRLQLQDGK